MLRVGEAGAAGVVEAAVVAVVGGDGDDPIWELVGEDELVALVALFDCATPRFRSDRNEMQKTKA